jgi:hypothetical protein
LGGAEEEPAVAFDVIEVQLHPIGEVEDEADLLRLLLIEEEAALQAEVEDEGIVVVQVEDEILRAAADPDDLRPGGLSF